MSIASNETPGTTAESAGKQDGDFQQFLNQNPTATAELERRSDQLQPTPTLQIAYVRWGVTVHTGNYSSARLDAEARVSMGGTAESTLKALQGWVHEHSPLSEEEVEHVRREQQLLRGEIQKLEQRKATLENDLMRLRKVFVTVGATPPPELVDDLPF